MGNYGAHKYIWMREQNDLIIFLRSQSLFALMYQTVKFVNQHEELRNFHTYLFPSYFLKQPLQYIKGIV